MAEDAIVYLNTVVSLNAGWSDLIKAYSEHDPMVHYIRRFAMILSPNLPVPLVKNETYAAIKEKFPLPDDGRKKIPMGSFEAYISAFEVVMRDHGIIGRKAGSGKDDTGDPVAVYFGGTQW